MVKIESQLKKNREAIAKRRSIDPIQNSLHSINSQRRSKGKKDITRSQLQEYLDFCLKAKLLESLRNRRVKSGHFSIDTFLQLKKQKLIIL